MRGGGAVPRAAVAEGASRARASDAVWTMATARDRQAGDAVMIRAHERLKNWMNASA